jgi:DNA repair protein RecN (Recombination protein N)
MIKEINPGEGKHQLKDVASGGELSRVLLSCRQLLAGRESISIFFFDEIDAGIGGETAISIGRALVGVSKKSQVLAITHLPQIAKFANKLIVVTKAQEIKESKIRTYSTIREVVGHNKGDEIQKMMPLSS